jgi:predicted ATPase
VERICKRLDGLPLALELAAARISILSPTALESRLAQLVDLPAGARDLPERQRTLRATIEWSYRLLEPGERTLLAFLAPFIGGARIEAVESVSVGSAAVAIEGLALLRDKSLLHVREDPDGELRFWMLETIRAFALDAAAADGLLSAAAERHAVHFLSVSEQADQHLRSADAGVWLKRLDAEYANLRAALDHLSQRAPERAIRMAGALAGYWLIRGHAPEGHQRFAAILAAVGPDAPLPAASLLGVARLACAIGENGDAETLLRRAIALAREAGETSVLAQCLSNLAVVEQLLDRSQESFDAMHREAIALARASADDGALAMALGNYATHFHIQGDVAKARPLYEKTLTVERRHGAPRGVALTACNLAEIALDYKELELAEALIDEALENARKINYRAIIASALVTRALLLLNRGEINAASQLLLEAIEPTAARLTTRPLPSCCLRLRTSPPPVMIHRELPRSGPRLIACSRGSNGARRRRRRPYARSGCHTRKRLPRTPTVGSEPGQPASSFRSSRR